MNRFDLEQAILQCWTVTSDIDTLNEYVMDSNLTKDQISNILIGMKELYELKFDKMFRGFENMVSLSYQKESPYSGYSYDNEAPF